MAGQETQKKVQEPTFIPGVVYIPDKIEVSEQLELMVKIESDFADFLTCLEEIIELMHLIKVKHLRSMAPIPFNVLREMRFFQGKGPLFKAFDKQTGGFMPGLSASLDNVFKRGMSSVIVTSRMKPVLKKLEPFKKKPLEADLVEIVGKKTKPLWHLIALEPTLDPYLSSQEEEGTRSHSPDRILSKKDLMMSRTHSEEIIASIKYLRYAKMQASNDTFQRQMDMLAASDAGFTTVKAHRDYLDTLKPHWFKDLVKDAAKAGLISSIHIINVLEKLGQYYEMSSTSLVLAKAKLCFIVMSMPIWDIARMPMQMAVNFILVSILKTPKSHNYLQEWLVARKLPYVVFPPYYAELADSLIKPVILDEPDTSNIK